MKEEALIIFARNPVYGKVKTRLAASIGDAAAFKVYEKLLKHTKSAAETINTDKIVFYSDGIAENDIWDNGFLKAGQEGEGLGERMKNAFQRVFQQGYSRAVIIGTDCPSLTSSIIKSAFEKLNAADIVIGPACDGGYYLLGMKKLHFQLFKNIPWGTSTVFKSTIEACKSSDIGFSLLPVLPDVDEEKDLIHFKRLFLSY